MQEDNRPAWGVAKQVGGQRALSVGDRLEIWLPKGTLATDRKEWVARMATTGEILPNRIAFSAPYYATPNCKQSGIWVSVHVTSSGKLQQMGPTNKPALSEGSLPAHLRGPPPPAGAARTGETYAGALSHRSGPTDRRVSLTTHVPEKATAAHIEQLDGPGRAALIRVGPSCWRTAEPLPCVGGWEFQLMYETPGKLFGTYKTRGKKFQVERRRSDHPPIEERVILDPGFDDTHTRYDRAAEMVFGLVERARADADNARIIELIVGSRSAAGMDYSRGLDRLLTGMLSPFACAAPAPPTLLCSAKT
jgi:hypothetical protein